MLLMARIESQDYLQKNGSLLSFPAGNRTEANLSTTNNFMGILTQNNCTLNESVYYCNATTFVLVHEKLTYGVNQSTAFNDFNRTFGHIAT